MTKKIDKIIKKAECIKNYLENNNKESGNIDGLIKSLISYRENIGDIPNNKRFYIVLDSYAMMSRNLDKPGYWHESSFKVDGRHLNYCMDRIKSIFVECIDFTAHIRDTIIGSCGDGVIYSIPPESDNDIADAVFDIQTFKVDDVLLSTELINVGFRPNTNTVVYVCDFD